MHEDTGQADSLTLAPFVHYSREEWRSLGSAAPLSLSEAQARDLRHTIEHVSLDELRDVYLPLSWLLSLHVAAAETCTRRFTHSSWAGKL